MVVVIGRRARAISEQEVDDHIFGYTAGNDVSARHWQRDDTQWWRAKSANSFSPIGPWVETEIPHGSDIRLVGRINGEVVQEAHTGELVHSIRRSIAFISQYMTLERGDLLFTGTPGNHRRTQARRRGRGRSRGCRRPEQPGRRRRAVTPPGDVAFA